MKPPLLSRHVTPEEGSQQIWIQHVNSQDYVCMSTSHDGLTVRPLDTSNLCELLYSLVNETSDLSLLGKDIKLVPFCQVPAMAGLPRHSAVPCAFLPGDMHLHIVLSSFCVSCVPKHPVRWTRWSQRNSFHR